MIFILNKLSRLYNSSLGFNHDYEINEIYSIHNSLLLIDAFRSKELVFDWGFVGISNKEYKNIEQIKYDSSFCIYYDNKILLEEQAKLFVPYKTIIIKYMIQNNWKNNFPIWYNSKINEWFNGVVLSNLETRPYIKVKDIFMEVIVSSLEKGSNLTVDDILFATRALSPCQDLYINKGKGYKILSETIDTLILEPDINTSNNYYYKLI